MPEASATSPSPPMGPSSRMAESGPHPSCVDQDHTRSGKSTQFHGQGGSDQWFGYRATALHQPDHRWAQAVNRSPGALQAKLLPESSSARSPDQGAQSQFVRFPPRSAEAQKLSSQDFGCRRRVSIIHQRWRTARGMWCHLAEARKRSAPAVGWYRDDTSYLGGVVWVSAGSRFVLSLFGGTRKGHLDQHGCLIQPVGMLDQCLHSGNLAA